MAEYNDPRDAAELLTDLPDLGQILLALQPGKLSEESLKALCNAALAQLYHC